MNYKDLLGIVAVVIAVAAQIPYLRDVFAKRTKPHAFSWLVWGILTATSFAAQTAGGAGAGAWVTLASALLTFFLFGIALRQGEKNITTSDWVSLCGALLALALWYVTSDPLLAVILIVVVDLLGFFPTIRKSHSKPHEETVITYALNGIKFLFALVALDTVSVVTALYPAYLLVANLAFAAMLVVRRKQLSSS